MIGRLFGRMHEIEEDLVIVDVGGVGYNVHVPLSTMAHLPQPGSKVTLYVHTHVREDAIVLYGFAERTELRLFQTLISVSGVGPRLGLTILSTMSPDAFVRAVINDDSGQLTKVPGIGKKTAARILVELKDKLEKSWVLPPDSSNVSGGSTTDLPVGARPAEIDARVALLTLGFSEQEASDAISKVIEDGTQFDGADQLVQAALKVLDRLS